MKISRIILKTIVIVNFIFLFVVLAIHFYGSKGLGPQSWNAIFIDKIISKMFFYCLSLFIFFIKEYLENYKQK